MSIMNFSSPVYTSLPSCNTIAGTLSSVALFSITITNIVQLTKTGITQQVWWCVTNECIIQIQIIHCFTLNHKWFTIDKDEKMYDWNSVVGIAGSCAVSKFSVPTSHTPPHSGIRMLYHYIIFFIVNHLRLSFWSGNYDSWCLIKCNDSGTLIHKTPVTINPVWQHFYTKLIEKEGRK